MPKVVVFDQYRILFGAMQSGHPLKQTKIIKMSGQWSVNFIFGPYPILTQCPNCKDDILTFIERNPNSTAILIGLFGCL